MPDAIHYNYPYAYRKWAMVWFNRKQKFSSLSFHASPIKQCWGTDKASDNMTRINIALGENGQTDRVCQPFIHDCVLVYGYRFK